MLLDNCGKTGSYIVMILPSNDKNVLFTKCLNFLKTTTKNKDVSCWCAVQHRHRLVMSDSKFLFFIFTNIPMLSNFWFQIPTLTETCLLQLWNHHLIIFNATLLRSCFPTQPATTEPARLKCITCCYALMWFDDIIRRSGEKPSKVLLFIAIQ